MDTSISHIKKVLVIGINPANTKIVEKIANAHPNIQFDYATNYEVTNVNLSNVKIIFMDLYYNTASTLITTENVGNIVEVVNKTGFVGFSFWLKTFLKANIEKYDFVIATYSHLQTAEWFHEFRKKCPIFCPEITSARLEGDKLFTKQILLDLGIPTPKFKVLDYSESAIISEIDNATFPVVIKTNALAGPLGTWVFKDDLYKTEIPKLITRINRLVRPENSPPATIYSEEFISGPEISAHFLCNGTSWKYIGAARDYKKSLDGDLGPNTNGTGCYSPVDYFTDNLKEQVFSYMDKILAYLNNMAIYFKGFMYLGIKLDENGVPNILEINTRPGTPEIITILDNVDNSNLLENFYRSATGQELLDIDSKPGYSVSVGLMHSEFPPPENPRFNSISPEILNLPNELNFYEHSNIFINQTCFGFITSSAPTKELASENIYRYLKLVKMNDYRYRNDIGFLE